MPDTNAQVKQLARSSKQKTEAVRFAAVGVAGTTIHYGVLIAVVEVAHLSPAIGTSAGFIVAAFVSYILNSIFTFEVRVNFVAGLMRNYASLALGLLINVSIVSALTRFQVEYVIAQVCATFVAFIWNYAASKFIVFRA